MLYLRYDETGHMDGGGAQVHRKLAIYSLAVKYKLQYIESPLIGVITPNVSPEVESRTEILAGWNKLTESLHASDPNALAKREFMDPWLSKDFFYLALQYNDLKVRTRITWEHIFATHIQPAYKQLRMRKFSPAIAHISRALDKVFFFYSLFARHDCVIVVTEPFNLIESGDDYIRSSKSIDELQKLKNEVTIGVHVRRGDLKATDGSRYLPDVYYVKTLKFVTDLLRVKSIGYSIIYYVDLPRNNNLFESERQSFSWGFATLEHSYTVNIESDSQALKSLSLSDVIIGSKSSYSFVAGLLSSALVIQPQWWIDNPSDWITINPDEFDPQLLEK